MAEPPEPPPRVPFEELQKLAAEVMGVNARAVTSPWHDKTAVHIGAIAVTPSGRSEYRSIDVAILNCQDMDGNDEDTHAYAVLFDVLEGILRRRFARRARTVQIGHSSQLQGAALPSDSPSESRLRFAPTVESMFPVNDDEDDDSA